MGVLFLLRPRDSVPNPAGKLLERSFPDFQELSQGGKVQCEHGTTGKKRQLCEHSATVLTRSHQNHRGYRSNPTPRAIAVGCPADIGGVFYGTHPINRFCYVVCVRWSIFCVTSAGSRRGSGASGPETPSGKISGHGNRTPPQFPRCFFRYRRADGRRRRSAGFADTG